MTTVPHAPGGQPVWMEDAPSPPTWRGRARRFLRAGFPGPFLSALVLALAYPPLELNAWAWLAFVPFVLLLPAGRARGALVRGWWLGFWFFLFSLFWLVRVTAGGWVILSAVCAFYWMPFAWMIHRWKHRLGTDNARTNLGQALLISLCWCGWETLRAHLFTGFGWNALGVSQFTNLAVIQVADLGGVAAVSFVVMWFNLSVAGAWMRRRAALGAPPGRGQVELLPALAALALALGYGLLRPATPGPDAHPLRAVAIQPNISQYEKWDEAFVERNYAILNRQTRLAAQANPDADLLLWPETAIPDDGSLGPVVRDWLASLTRPGIPLLVGALVYTQSGLRMDWHNAAILVDVGGRFAERYDKRHRVMFGEYVPTVFKWLLPFLQKMTAIGEDVSAGERAVVFGLPGTNTPFSVNICFEDVMPWLSRDYVRAGARLLVNQTNDAWFDPFWGSRQHLANGVFRAVENRVPILRCANSGISCGIDTRGRIHDVLRDPGGGEHRVEGFQPITAFLPGPSFQPTFYTRHGDVFGFSCAALALLWLGGAVLELRRERPGSKPPA